MIKNRCASGVMSKRDVSDTEKNVVALNNAMGGAVGGDVGDGRDTDMNVPSSAA